MSREKIIAGEQISERRLLNAQNAGFVGLIPPDKRAITVAVTEVTGVAGFVKPGDYVDVVVTFDRQDTGEFASNFVLQNILVLAANHDTESSAGDQTVKDKKDAVKTATVTLAVSPMEEHWLALSDEKGKIRLALRPLFPDMVTVHTETATPVKLVGLQNGPGNSTRGRAAALSAPVVAPPAQFAPATPAPQEQPRVKEPIPQYQPGITVIRGTKVDVVPY
jgi:pilus assembly protein CpaB